MVCLVHIPEESCMRWAAAGQQSAGGVAVAAVGSDRGQQHLWWRPRW